MHQKTSNRRTSKQWQNLIDQQQESGVSQKAFCELNNICLSTFTLWKRKLTQTAVTSDQPSPDPEWLKLPTGFDDPVIGQRKWDMELELPGGIILRMQR